MLKLNRSLLFLALSIFSALAAWPARAGLKELIRAYPGETAVIVPVAGYSGNNGYGLLVMPPDDYAREVGLLAPGKLENAYFRVEEFKVTGKRLIDYDPALPADEQTYLALFSDEVLPTTDFDGANVLYHLTLARNYYAKLSAASGFQNSALNRKIAVRVRADLIYNSVTHAGEKPKFNDAVYIPADPDDNWRGEIWFDARRGREDLNGYELLISAGTAITTGSWETGAVVVPMEIYEHHNAGLDAAKMPNVIYHEAFHYATDMLGPDPLFPMSSEGNPVAEDYANYFGSSIIGKPEIAEIDEFSSRYFKRRYNKIRDINDTLPDDYNASSFGPSVFWQIRRWLGKDRADSLIWNSIHYLKGSRKHTAVPGAVSLAAHSDKDLSGKEIRDIDDLLAQHAQSYVNLELKFNPDEALAKMDDSKIREAAKRIAAAVRGIPDDLPQGVSLTGDEKQRIGDLAEQMEARAKKGGFKAKVVSALKGVGYAGSAVFSASEAPLTVATDFTTGLFLGHGLISEREQRLRYLLAGAGGGIAATYYAYAGLGALGLTNWVIPITSSAMGIAVIHDFVCAKANLQGRSEKDRYCLKNAKIMAAITGATARAGSRLGKRMRRLLR